MIDAHRLLDWSPLVRLLRVKAGLTQAQLAQKLKVQEGTVRRWEHGLRQPSLEMLDALSSACGYRVTFGVSLLPRGTGEEGLAAFLEDDEVLR